jgi:GAF domain-containing protein
MSHMTKRLRDCADLQAALDCALTESLDVSGTHLGNIQIMDWKRGALEIKAQRNFQEEFLAFFNRVTVVEGSACARALRTGQVFVIEDVAVDNEFAPYKGIAERAGFRAVQSTPLISGSGAMIGVLSTHFPARHRPHPATMTALKQLAQSIADAVVFHRMRALSIGNDRLDIDAIFARGTEAIAESTAILRKAELAMTRWQRAPLRDEVIRAKG